MYKQSDLKKLQFVLEKIEDAINYKNNYRRVTFTKLNKQ